MPFFTDQREPSSEGDMDREARESLGTWGRDEARDPLEEAIVGTMSKMIHFHQHVKLSGPTDTANYKRPSWLTKTVDVINEDPRSGWGTRADFGRDADYYFAKTLAYLWDTRDKRLLEALAVADMQLRIDEMAQHQERFYTSAVMIRDLLSSLLAKGELGLARKELVKFWRAIADLSDTDRDEYERLFTEVPVLNLVAQECDGLLPRRLVPPTKEWSDEELESDEGLPPVPANTELRRVSAEDQKEHNRKYMRDYMREYRAGKRRS